MKLSKLLASVILSAFLLNNMAFIVYAAENSENNASNTQVIEKENNNLIEENEKSDEIIEEEKKELGQENSTEENQTEKKEPEQENNVEENQTTSSNEVKQEEIIPEEEPKESEENEAPKTESENLNKDENTPKIEENKGETNEEITNKIEDDEKNEPEQEAIEMMSIAPIQEIGTKTISDGTYVITSAMNSNLALDIANNSKSSGANVEIWEKNNQNNQKFHITYLNDGYYKLEVVNSGKYLSGTAEMGKTEDNVVQKTYEDKDNQKWIIKSAGNGYYYIISKASSLYLDIFAGNSTKGTNVQLYQGKQGINQKFKFTKVNVVSGSRTMQNGTYTISSALNFNQVLDVSEASTASNANVEIYTRNSNNNQRFELEYLNDGYYKITAVHSKKVLTVADSSINKGANVRQENDQGLDSQKWVIKNAGNGYYYIISKCNGLYLDLHGGTSASKTNVEVYESNLQNWQKFKFYSMDIVNEKTIQDR